MKKIISRVFLFLTLVMALWLAPISVSAVTYISYNDNQCSIVSIQSRDYNGSPITYTYRGPSSVYSYGQGYKYVKTLEEPTYAFTYANSDDHISTPTNAGSYELIVRVKALYEESSSVWPESVDGRSMLTVTFTQTAAFTINQIAGTATLTQSSWTYGNPVQPVYASETNGNTPTIEYKLAGAADSTYTGTVPTDVGSYTVRATFAATRNYKQVVKTADFTISPKELTVSVAAEDKKYDGTDNATLRNIELQGQVGTDDVSLGSVTAKFSSANVGTQNVTVSGLTLQGTDQGNYTLSSTTAACTATIQPRQLKITGTTVNNKDYDGNTSAVINQVGTLSGQTDVDAILSGDAGNLQIKAGTASFDSKNVGTRTVSFSGFALSGTASGNYTLVGQPASVTATISQKPVTITGVKVQPTKVYDGTKEAKITDYGTIDGLVSGDDVHVMTDNAETNCAKATYASANASDTPIVITFSGFSISGDDAGNYSLQGQPEATTAAITPKELTVTVEAEDKKYDGTDKVTIHKENISLRGQVGSEDVSLSGDIEARFNSANAGKQGVTISGLTLQGRDKDNYTLSANADCEATIYPRKVIITGTTAKNKNYDGNTSAAVDQVGTISSAATDETILAEDVSNLQITAGTASFDSKNVGTWTVSFSGFTLSGSASVNYELASQPKSVTATINKKPVTISGVKVQPTKVYDGTKDAKITDYGTVDGLASGDDVHVMTDNSETNCAEAAYASADASDTPIEVAFSGFDISGNDAGNYTLQRQPEAATAMITPRALTITAVNAKDKVFDGTTTATVNLEFSGLVGDDTVDLSNMKATFSDALASDTEKTITVTGLSVSSNYTLPDGITVKALISRRPLNIVDVGVRDKVYDGTNKAQFWGAPIVKDKDLVPGYDTLILEIGDPIFSDVAVGENIPINFTEFTLSGDDCENYTLIQPSGITANITSWNADSSCYIADSGWQSGAFTMTAAEGYALSETNTADGDWVNKLTRTEETADGVLNFYVKNSEGHISEKIAMPYKIDMTAPTGTIEITNGDTWTQFSEGITFDLYLNNKQTVTITAADKLAGTEADGSGINKIEYYVTKDILDLNGVKAIGDWSIYEGVFDIEPDAELVVYVRLTDNVGNVNYLSSNGMVLDHSAPVISGAEDGRTYCAAVTLTITDKYLDRVTLNGKTAELTGDNTLTLNPAEGQQTVTATDKAGNSTTIAITVNDAHTWGDWSSNGNNTHTRICIYDATHTETGDCHGGEAATCKDRSICDDCKAPYGELAPENHSNLKHVEKKDATTAADGNIEYWYCDGCGRCFRDENAAEEIALADTVIPKLPLIIKGEGQTAAVGGENALKFTTDAKNDEFSHVLLDGKELDPKDYTVEATEDLATVVTLNSAYVAALSEGVHTLDIVSKNGTAETNFTVEHNLTYTSAKAATTTEEGNQEYWYCAGCGKYFRDENAAEEITLADTVVAKLPPLSIEGEKKSVAEGEEKEMTFTFDTKNGDFVRAEIDGEVLDAKNYTENSNGTFTLNSDCIAALPAGEHTLRIVSEGAVTTVKITVSKAAKEATISKAAEETTISKAAEESTTSKAAEEGTAGKTAAADTEKTASPKTGDNSNGLLWLALLFVSGAAAAVSGRMGKRTK